MILKSLFDICIKIIFKWIWIMFDANPTDKYLDSYRDNTAQMPLNTET